jgi:hypothetical protein
MYNAEQFVADAKLLAAVSAATPGCEPWEWCDGGAAGTPGYLKQAVVRHCAFKGDMLGGGGADGDADGSGMAELDGFTDDAWARAEQDDPSSLQPPPVGAPGQPGPALTCEVHVIFSGVYAEPVPCRASRAWAIPCARGWLI